MKSTKGSSLPTGSFDISATVTLVAKPKSKKRSSDDASTAESQGSKNSSKKAKVHVANVLINVNGTDNQKMGEDTGTASTAHPPESGTDDIPMSHVKSTVDDKDYSSSISATDYALLLHGPTNTDSSVMRSNSTSLSTLTDSTVSTSSLTDWKPRGSRYEHMPQLRQDGTSSHSDSDDHDVLAYAMSA